MVTVSFTHLGGECPWPEHTRPLGVRALDVARAAATTLTGGVRSPHRTAAVALAVLGHLDDAGRPSGLDALDATARAEVVQRISAGLARLVAEQGPTRTVDFYNLDAAGPHVAVERRPGARRRPDFAGLNAVRLWSVFGARGRTGIGSPLATRRKALAEVRAAELEDVEPWARISCVAKLRPEGIEVFADGAPAPSAAPLNRYRLDADALVTAYYAFGPLEPRGDFAWLALAPRLALGVHRRIVEAGDDVEALLETRLELQGELDAARTAAPPGLSVGRDGLVLGDPEAA